MPEGNQREGPCSSNDKHDLEAELLQIVHPGVTRQIREYVREHIVRFELLFDAIPPGNGDGRLLDIGGRANLLPPYFTRLRYAYVAMANKWQSEFLDPDCIRQYIPSTNFRCDYFDAESEPFPYEDGSFDTAVCSEVIEHLTHDPAHMLAEINRVLRHGGKLVLTTPNITSVTALYRLIGGVHPQSWSVYTGKHADRHNREFAPKEIARLLEGCGFDEIAINTFSLTPVSIKIRLLMAWVFIPWFIRGQFGSSKHRGEFILAVATKKGPVRERYPRWLYEEIE